MKGWIKLHRQIIENEFYFSERFTRTQAWLDILLLATHTLRTLFIRGIEIKLQPGELAHSQKTLAERWKWNFKTVKKFLNDLKKRGMVETNFSNVTTIISIKNWNLYQDMESKTETRTESKTETNKNDKNGKIIAAVRSLIHGSYEEKGLYSVLGKIRKEYGDNKLREIIGKCISNGNEFENPGKLLAYFAACKNNNGVQKRVSELKEL